MQSIKVLPFARAISTFTPKCKPISPSSFSLQLDSYLETSTRNHVYAYNKAINQLMKSGSLGSALKLFDEMLIRDVVTWNIVISGHRRFGFLRKALCLYSQMVSQGCIESSSTLSTVLSMCSDAAFIQTGLQVHSRVIVLGFSMNTYIGSALVDLYLSMGSVDFALRLFKGLTERNLATWNQLLRGFVELGRSNKLVGLYNIMRSEDVVPSPLTFSYLIRGVASKQLVDEGEQLHSCVIKMGWSESHLFVANALVDFYSACGSVADAEGLFEGIPMEDVISWNSLVSVYANNGLASNALESFMTMQLWGKKPSIRSFVGLLNLSSGNENLLLGEQVHSLILKSGVDCSSVYVQSALIDMYGKFGKIENSVSIFENVQGRTLEVCNSLMTTFTRCKLMEDVIELFGLMVDEGIGFDEVSLSTTINGLSMSSFASLTSCKLLHTFAVKSGFEHDLAVSCSLIDSYSRFGHLKWSCQVFEQLSSPNVICFTSIINAHSRNRMGMESLELLGVMIKKGLKPDKLTFLCVLTACNHSGLIKEGKMVFDSMKVQHGIDPERQHFLYG